MHGRERPSWPQGGMFSEATHDIARQRQPQHQPPYPATQALAHPSFNSTRNRSLESFPTMSISYPESSQRTRMRDVQFSPSDEGFMPAQNAPHPNNRDVLLSGAEFSPAPIPSDRPPPPPRPPTRSFSNRYFVPPQQSPTSNGPARSPPSFNQPLNSYRELTSSLSDATDDNLTQASHHHHPSNFIPIVPESSADFRAEAPPSFDATEKRSFRPSSPQSDSSLSPPPIETIRMQSIARPRKPSPVKKHICEVCLKEFPRPSGLKTHMNIHNNLRPFKCEFPNCSKTFSVLSNMRRHYRIHSGTASPPAGPPSEVFEVNFEELIEAPEQPPPPPSSLSHAPFRVRWVPTNLFSRTAIGARTQAPDPGWRVGAGHQSREEDHANSSMGSYETDPAANDTDEMYYEEQSWNARAHTRYPGSASDA